MASLGCVHLRSLADRSGRGRLSRDAGPAGAGPDRGGRDREGTLRSQSARRPPPGCLPPGTRSRRVRAHATAYPPAACATSAGRRSRFRDLRSRWQSRFRSRGKDPGQGVTRQNAHIWSARPPGRRVEYARPEVMAGRSGLESRRDPDYSSSRTRRWSRRRRSRCHSAPRGRPSAFRRRGPSLRGPAPPSVPHVAMAAAVASSLCSVDPRKS